MIVDTDFWRMKDSWPADGQGYVFLGRAVHEVGRFLFADGWTGQEPAMLPMTRLAPKPPVAAYGERLRAHELLVKFHPEFGRKPPKGLSINFTDGEWKTLTNTINQHNANCARFDQAARQIAVWCQSDKLKMGLRPLSGGAIVDPLQSVLWQTEQWHSRFHRCQMNLADPFGFAISGKHHQYIFLSRYSLDTCLGIAAKPLMSPSKKPAASSNARPGRRKGDVQYPDDAKIMAAIADRFRSDLALEGLSEHLVVEVAAALGLITKDFDSHGVTRRLRPKLKSEYPDIAPRISEERINS